MIQISGVVLLDAFLPTTTAAAAAVDVLGRMVVWWSSVDGDDDAGSQNNANLFSRGRFQLPFLPGVAFFALSVRMVELLAVAQ